VRSWAGGYCSLQSQRRRSGHTGPHQATLDADEKDPDLWGHGLVHGPGALALAFEVPTGTAAALLRADVQSPALHAWALKDNLDADAFGWSFSQHRENRALGGVSNGSVTAI
jgi:hypothetical protein